ncbi:MAG: MFS transporter [Planctomycetota bacterium]
MTSGSNHQQPSSPWRDPRIPILWCAQTINAFGDMLTFLALPMLVYSATGSMALLALTIFVDSVPMIFLSPLAGALADRWDRRRLLVMSSLLCAVLTVPPALVGDDWLIATIMITVALKSAVQSCFRPAVSAILPALVSRQQLLGVNAAFGTSFQAVLFLGPLIGAVIVSYGGMRMLLLIDSLTFLVAALLLGRLALPDTIAGSSARVAWATLRRDIAIGFRHLRSSRLLMIILGIGVVTMFGQGFITPAWLPYVVEVLHEPAESFGILVSVQGLGFLLGSLAVLFLGLRQGRNTLGLYVFFLIASGSAIFLQVTTTAFPLFLVWATLVGVFGAGRNVLTTTLIQEQVEPSLLGRITSTMQMCRQTAHLTAVLVAGVIADLMSTADLFFLACLLWLIGCVGGALSILTMRPARTAEAA